MLGVKGKLMTIHTEYLIEIIHASIMQIKRINETQL